VARRGREQPETVRPRRYGRARADEVAPARLRTRAAAGGGGGHAGLRPGRGPRCPGPGRPAGVARGRWRRAGGPGRGEGGGPVTDIDPVTHIAEVREGRAADVSAAPPDAREQAADLAQRIDEAQYRYYVLDQPTISDAEYDGMIRDLERLEAEYPDLRTPD